MIDVSTMFDECVLVGCTILIGFYTQILRGNLTNFRPIFKKDVNWARNRQFLSANHLVGIANRVVRRVTLGNKGVAAMLQMTYGDCHAIGRVIGSGGMG